MRMVKRLACLLLDHDFPVYWHGPNGIVESVGHCSRCGKNGSQAFLSKGPRTKNPPMRNPEVSKEVVLEETTNADWVEQKVAFIHAGGEVSLRSRYKNAEQTDWRLWEDSGIMLRFDALAVLYRQMAGERIRRARELLRLASAELKMSVDVGVATKVLDDEEAQMTLDLVGDIGLFLSEDEYVELRYALPKEDPLIQDPDPFV